jgi:inner membrane protein
LDNLTHTATGLFLSRAGMNRWTPQASAILMLAANAPDIDVVSAAGGSVGYLRYHRHLTHSLIAMPVMAIFCVLVVRAISRKPLQWTGAFAAAFVGVASHLLLDYSNGYGIRLLLPFSPVFYRLEWTNVVDLWIWAAFLLALAAPFLARLVGSEIASSSRRAPYPGRGWPLFALAFLTIYIGARGVLHARAVGELESRIYQNAEPLRVAAVPGAANPLRWRGVVETEGFFALPEVNLAGIFDPSRARILHKPEADAALVSAMESAKRTEAFRVFLQFAEFPLWSLTPDDRLENGMVTQAADMRFLGWSANALEDAHGAVKRSWIQLGGMPSR